MSIGQSEDARKRLRPVNITFGIVVSGRLC
jgi:hypothetical protein